MGAVSAATGFDRRAAGSASAMLLAAVACIALALLAVVYVDARMAARENLMQRSRASAGQLGAALRNQAAQMRAAAAALGKDARIMAALADQNLALQPSIVSLADVESVQLQPLGQLGIADPGFEPGALRNNLEIHLAAEAFKGDSTAVEAYAGDGGWLLVAAAPLGSHASARPDGVLLLRVDLASAFKRISADGLDQGSYSIWTSADGADPRPVLPASTGGGEEPPVRVACGIGKLLCGFKPAAAYIAASSRTPVASYAGVLIAVGVLGLLLLIVQRSSAARLNADVAALLAFIARSARERPDAPALHTPELDALLLELKQRGERSTVARKPRPERSPGNIQQAQKAPTADSNPLDIRDESPSRTAVQEVESEAGEPFPEQVFRDYDIRGKAELFTPELVHDIGRAIGSTARERDCPRMVLGADGRESSPALKDRLMRGLLASGVEVIDIGTVATPMLYFACHHLETASGVMITGSHHPADHNGFKLMIGGEALCGDGIASLRERIRKRDFLEGKGSYRVQHVEEDYLKAVVDDVLVDAPLRVAVDCGNGAASVIAADLFQALGCTVIPLFCELDGRFPHHDPDPSVPGNLRHLLAAVSEQRADLGIAFDGDADRLGVVAASGRIVSADRLMMLFARDVLSRNPGADVVFDVKCSADLARIVTENGGRPIMCQSGHSRIKQKMRESGALLGGEFTGHICFRDRWFGFDDALYAAARLLEILTTDSRPFDDLLRELPAAVGTHEIHIEIDEDIKFSCMKKIVESFSVENAQLIKLDGIRAEFRDGWGLVRASNTSAALTLRFEARDEVALERIQAVFRSELIRLLPVGTRLSF